MEKNLPIEQQVLIKMNKNISKGSRNLIAVDLFCGIGEPLYLLFKPSAGEEVRSFLVTF